MTRYFNGESIWYSRVWPQEMSTVNPRELTDYGRTRDSNRIRKYTFSLCNPAHFTHPQPLEVPHWKQT